MAGLLGGGKVKTPPPPKVARLPRPQDDATMAAKQRQADAIKRRAGRASTILSDATMGETTGASGQKLGA